MTHLAHLTRTDLRRFGVPLAVWVLLQIADTVLRGVRPAISADPRLGTMLDLLAMVLIFTRWLGMLILVALLVQTHSLVGSDAFWMTRPIRWRDLLASRLLLLGTTFVVIPPLCEVGLMLASRAPAADIPPVALQMALFQSAWLFLFMALSAMTRNLARLAVVGGSMLVGLVLVLNIMIAVMWRRMPDGPQLISVTARTLTSPAGGVVMLVLLMLSPAAAVAVQYRTRLVRASVATGAAGIALTVLVLLAWPSPEDPMPVPAWANDGALNLVSKTPVAEFRPLNEGHPWSSGGAWQIGALPLQVDGVADSWLATVKLAHGTLTFGDGTTLTTLGNGYSAGGRAVSSDETLSEIAVRHVLGVNRLLATSLDHLADTSTPAMVITQADFDKQRNLTATYRGRFVVDLDRLVAVSTLPLQAGATFQGNRHRILIDQVSYPGRAAAVRVRQFTSTTIFDGGILPLSFYLRNRATGEAVAGAPLGQLGAASGLGMPLVLGVSTYSAAPGTGFYITSGYFRFPGEYRIRESPVELSAEWLSQAELVILQTIPGGSVTRAVEVPGVQMVVAPTPAVSGFSRQH